MAEFDLNLSTKPFPAYRAVNLLLIVVLVLLAAVSVWQASGFFQYSNMVRSIRSQEQESRVEAESLGKRVAELESRLDRPESTAKLNEIGFLNLLILKKNFSWTKLIALLEEMVPENVHLTNLIPDVATNGTVMLRMGLRARSIADAKKFLQNVEKSSLFEKLDLKVEEKKDPTVSTDVDFTLSAIYYPQRDTR